jgi:hypothetical protein
MVFPNPKTSAVRHTSIVNYNHPNQQVTLLHLAGCASVDVYLIAWCRMSLPFVFVLMHRPVVKASSTLHKINGGYRQSVVFEILLAL